MKEKAISKPRILLAKESCVYVYVYVYMCCRLSRHFEVEESTTLLNRGNDNYIVYSKRDGI
jgi:hypothetical protein